jgi:hypothetical protein
VPTNLQQHDRLPGLEIVAIRCPAFDAAVRESASVERLAERRVSKVTPAVVTDVKAQPHELQLSED